MIAGAKYGHTNLIARDWRALARFYEEQFGCTPVPPERDFKGSDLERGTGIPGAELRGAHLRLPGHGAEGPTLEIFNYNILKEKPEVAVNRPGFGHIAFVVDDVPSAREAVLAAGGRFKSLLARLLLPALIVIPGMLGASPALAQVPVATLDELRRELSLGDFISLVQTTGDSVTGRLRRFGDIARAASGLFGTAHSSGQALAGALSSRCSSGRSP